VQVRKLKFGTARKNVSMCVRTLNFGTAWKNIGVQVHTLNLELCGMHTHNNGARGLHNIGRAQRSLVGACAMWVYVVVRQFKLMLCTEYWCTVGAY
jgi:hypothetical protein